MDIKPKIRKWWRTYKLYATHRNNKFAQYDVDILKKHGHKTIVKQGEDEQGFKLFNVYRG